MVVEVPVTILLEKLQNLHERVRPPELRAEVVTAVNELSRIFSFLTKPNQRNITENLKELLDSIYSADNTIESVLTTVQLSLGRQSLGLTLIVEHLLVRRK